jgi:hypothetical protein
MAQVVYGADVGGKYQVTRAPEVPTSPAGPNRPIYLAMAAVAALGGGLAAAYAKGAVTGIFVSPRQLEHAFELPVVCTVSWEAAWHTGRRRSPSALNKLRDNTAALLRLPSKRGSD